MTELFYAYIILHNRFSSETLRIAHTQCGCCASDAIAHLTDASNLIACEDTGDGVVVVGGQRLSYVLQPSLAAQDQLNEPLHIIWLEPAIELVEELPPLDLKMSLNKSDRYNSTYPEDFHAVERRLH